MTFSRITGNEVKLVTPRNGATITVEFHFVFRQMMIVGEGENFEYATNLATKYGDASGPRGWEWIVATQYDTKARNDIVANKNIFAWNGVVAAAGNPQQNYDNAILKNMIDHVNHPVRQTRCVEWRRADLWVC